MPDYLLLMHDDATSPVTNDWGPYLGRLQATGNFQGGSAIGTGTCARKAGAVPATTSHITGFLRVGAGSLEEAKALLSGNPVFEAGGTVEIRELPRVG
jgi:hypothetical protein